MGSACLQIPKLYRFVVRSRGQVPAVWAEYHGTNSAGMSGERFQFLARCCVPNLDRVVERAAGQALIIWTKSDAPNICRVTCENQQVLPRLRG
jgi:hypothetical protein